MLNLTKIMLNKFQLLTIYSLNLISMWMGLELNLFTILPILNFKSSICSNESLMKYFLIQAYASILLLIMLINKSMFFLINSNFMLIILLFIVIMYYLLIKLSLMKFHIWLPLMIEGLNWSSCLNMFTWQIKPMIVINTLLGMNQNSIRKIMSISSINNSTWMLFMMMINKNVWMNYFIILFYFNY